MATLFDAQGLHSPPSRKPSREEAELLAVFSVRVAQEHLERSPETVTQLSKLTANPVQKKLILEDSPDHKTYSSDSSRESKRKLWTEPLPEADSPPDVFAPQCSGSEGSCSPDRWDVKRVGKLRQSKRVSPYKAPVECDFDAMSTREAVDDEELYVRLAAMTKGEFWEWLRNQTGMSSGRKMHLKAARRRILNRYYARNSRKNRRLRASQSSECEGSSSS